MFGKKYHGPEHRKYIRLDSVFPVGFRLLGWDDLKVMSDWLQGFTNNIGKGGLCLAISNLKPELAALIKSQRVKVSLNLEMPLFQKPVAALATVIWIQETDSASGTYI